MTRQPSLFVQITGLTNFLELEVESSPARLAGDPLDPVVLVVAGIAVNLSSRGVGGSVVER
jgi:hypothetical protein